MIEVVGLDVGGAHLKGATSSGRAATIPFALWRAPEKLTGALIDLLIRFPEKCPIALTMTGELCDCFPSKSEGVRHILESVRRAVGERPIYVWRNDGKWAGVQYAAQDPLPVASANWLAAAAHAASFLPGGTGWFLDLGSTTFDLIPLSDGDPPLKEGGKGGVGQDDLSRLCRGELAYLGSTRTPVGCIASHARFRGGSVTLAAEFFATMADVYTILGKLPEETSRHDTADRQPGTLDDARRRLARMLCADVSQLTSEELSSIAEQLAAAHADRLLGAMGAARSARGLGDADSWGGIVLAGSGEWLLAELIARLGAETGPVISMAGKLGPAVSSALCAYAVAVFLAERLGK